MNDRIGSRTETPTLHDWIAAPVRVEERVRQLHEDVREVAGSVERVGDRLGDRLRNEESRGNEARHDARRLEQKLDGLEAKIESLTVLADDHFTQSVLDPLAQRVFAVLDVVDQVNRQKGGEPDDVLRGIGSALLDLLLHLGVSPMQSRPPTRFQPRVHKPVQLVPTFDSDLDGCIAHSVRRGFRRSRTVVRHEAVAVYRLSATTPCEEGGAA